MDTRTAQWLFAEAGYYQALVDGKIGPATRASVEQIERNARDTRGGAWSWPRRIDAAAQRMLAAQGYYTGQIDGLTGPNTESATAAWRVVRSGMVTVPPLDPVVVARHQWPDRRDLRAMNALFGQPGGAQATAGRCELPFSFVLACDEGTRIDRFSCNSAVATVFESIFQEAARHYGEAAFRRLRLDRFRGCFADRKMRGSSTTTSTHAWGVAVDLDPINNQLSWSRSKAWLARSDYEAFWTIVERHGATSFGRARDYDRMHFQLCNE